MGGGEEGKGGLPNFFYNANYRPTTLVMVTLPQVVGPKLLRRFSSRSISSPP